MNTTEYIASGILEQYVSGTVSPQERQEVECMSHIYPEIKAELLSLQQAFEAMATDSAVTPPAHLRLKILDGLKELNDNSQTQSSTPSEKPVETQASAKVVKMRTNYMQIAATLLLLISTALGYLLYQNMQEKNTMADNIALLKTDMEKQQNTMNLQNQKMIVMQSPDFKKVQLAGIKEKSPASSVVIYWNPKSEDVYVTLAALPSHPEDKQYQLWAIADGKPVDMGMLESNKDTIFQKMKNIGNATAFAITLENKGGVPSPTMSEMYVMGGI